METTTYLCDIVLRTWYVESEVTDDGRVVKKVTKEAHEMEVGCTKYHVRGRGGREGGGGLTTSPRVALLTATTAIAITADADAPASTNVNVWKAHLT